MNDPACTAALLEAFRRERNGLAADTMHYDGARYDVNYGVSLPTVRAVARRLPPDHDAACRLLLRREREMQLTAFHLADPARLADAAEAERWRQSLCNTELAEEAAFALLCRVPTFPDLLADWLTGDEPLAAYAAMRAAVRHASPQQRWLDPMLATLQRTTADPSHPAWVSHCMADALTAFAARLAGQDSASRAAVAAWVLRLGPTPPERHIADELAWRLETV